MVRADAQRNLAAVLQAAKEVFAESGVDAPVRAIAARAGVGVGTIYRHFPQRSDLVAAVFRREVDACAAAAPILAAELGPVDALASWLQRYTGFIATKRLVAGCKASFNRQEIFLLVGIAINAVALIDHRTIVIDKLRVMVGKHVLIASFKHAVVFRANNLFLLRLLFAIFLVGLVAGKIPQCTRLVLLEFAVLSFDEFNARGTRKA